MLITKSLSRLLKAQFSSFRLSLASFQATHPRQAFNGVPKNLVDKSGFPVKNIIAYTNYKTLKIIARDLRFYLHRIMNKHCLFGVYGLTSNSQMGKFEEPKQIMIPKNDFQVPITNQKPIIFTKLPIIQKYVVILHILSVWV